MMPLVMAFTLLCTNFAPPATFVRSQDPSRDFTRSCLPKMSSEELPFLRSEVAKLERIIESSAESRAAMARQAQLSQRSMRTCQEYLEIALSEVVGARTWEALQAEPPELGQLGRITLSEMRALAVEAGLLRTELAAAEAERAASHEVEVHALSVARSYRGFASQGAARLDELKERIRTMSVRTQRQLDELRASAVLAMRRRSLRSVVGMRSGLAARAALYRWQQTVAIERFTDSISTQLQASQRQEEAHLREQRQQMERRLKADRAHAQAMERECAKAQEALAQLEPLRAELEASRREGAATHARLGEALNELEMLRAERALLVRALEDERRVSAIRLQAERKLAETEQGLGLLGLELSAGSPTRSPLR